MPKRLTHKEFMERFMEKNSNANNIEVLGTYVNAQTKILCKCKIDGYEWEVKPNHLINSKSGCPKCSGRHKTHEEFIKELEKINSDIEILGTYINSYTKIKCKCKIDGCIWEVMPKDLLKGRGCPICGEKNRIKKQTKTHEEFIKEFMEKNSKANDIEILGQYVNSKTPIKCRCKIDGYIWTPTPSDLLYSNRGCPLCGGSMKLTHEEFINRIKEINNDIEVLGQYVNSKTHIEVKCKIDEHIWKVKPCNLLSGKGCPQCGGSMKKTYEQFMEEMKEINNDIEILGQYKNNKIPIECKCKIDGHIWETTPSNLLKGKGCPKCNSSKGEKRISRYLEDNEINYISQYTFEDCKCKNVLPFDFYIPSLNMAIEYDGRQHFEIVEYFGGIDGFIDTKIRDTIKTWYCKQNNINLIRIPYWNFDNIEEILEKELTLYKECSII